LPSILYVVATQLGGSLEVGIIRQFTFSSSVQCMSVVVRVLGADHMDVYVKGAPEKVASLCRPHTGKTPVHHHHHHHKHFQLGLNNVDYCKDHGFLDSSDQ